MQKPLAGMTAAILVANGFNEQEMTTFQRGMMEAGAAPKIVSVENSLANGWQGAGWGHYFAVDKALSDALAADYDILIVPGGPRSHDKLKATAHTRRFIGGFMAAYKPVLAIGDAVALLAETRQLSGVMVTGPEEAKEAVKAAEGIWSENTPTIHNNLMSVIYSPEHAAEHVETLVNFVREQYSSDDDEQQAA
jgi:protease I